MSYSKTAEGRQPGAGGNVFGGTVQSVGYQGSVLTDLNASSLGLTDSRPAFGCNFNDTSEKTDLILLAVLGLCRT